MPRSNAGSPPRSGVGGLDAASDSMNKEEQTESLVELSEEANEAKRYESEAKGPKEFRRILTSAVHFIQNFTCFGNKIISGLDRVVFGTVPASEAVTFWNGTIKPPQYLFYMVSGAVCDVLQFLLDYVFFYTLLGIKDASICWVGSFTLSIAARHTSHRYLVFGDYVGGYWKSLARMYGGYSFSIVLSTAFNAAVTHGTLQLPHIVAYICTLLWTGVANYFILKYLWSCTKKPTTVAQVESERGGLSNAV